MPLGWWWRGAGRSFLEGDDLKGHTENLGHLLGELAVVTNLIAGPPQSPPDHLFAQELRHERPQSDDVSHGVAVPALRQHAYTDDAAHLFPWRMERLAALPGKLLKSFWIDRTSLPIFRPL